MRAFVVRVCLVVSIVGDSGGIIGVAGIIGVVGIVGVVGVDRRWRRREDSTRAVALAQRIEQLAGAREREALADGLGIEVGVLQLESWRLRQRRWCRVWRVALRNVLIDEQRVVVDVHFSIKIVNSSTTTRACERATETLRVRV